MIILLVIMYLTAQAVVSLVAVNITPNTGTKQDNIKLLAAATIVNVFVTLIIVYATKVSMGWQ